MPSYRHRRHYPPPEDPDPVKTFLRDHASKIIIAALTLALGVLLAGPGRLLRLALAHGPLVLGIFGAVLVAVLTWRVAQAAPAAWQRFTERHGFTPVLLVLGPVAAGAIWLTFTRVGWQGLSGHAAALGALFVWALGVALFNRYPSHQVNFFEEMSEGNRAAAIGFAAVSVSIAILVLGAISVITVPVPRGATAPAQPPAQAPDSSAAEATASNAAARPAHVDTLLSYRWVREQGDNRGPGIDKFLASVGLGPGYAYCAAATSYCLDAAGAREPSIRDARSRMFRPTADWTRAEVLGGRSLPRGVLTVHRYSKYRGHIGMLDRQEGRGRGSVLHTVEANTSCPATSAAPAGEGVCRKRRPVTGSNYLAPVLFSQVTY